MAISSQSMTNGKRLDSAQNNDEETIVERFGSYSVQLSTDRQTWNALRR
jgi:hypothetical protein